MKVVLFFIFTNFYSFLFKHVFIYFLFNLNIMISLIYAILFWEVLPYGIFSLALWCSWQQKLSFAVGIAWQ